MVPPENSKSSFKLNVSTWPAVQNRPAAQRYLVWQSSYRHEMETKSLQIGIIVWIFSDVSPAADDDCDA
jgi:hypothetical protein